MQKKNSHGYYVITLCSNKMGDKLKRALAHAFHYRQSSSTTKTTISGSRSPVVLMRFVWDESVARINSHVPVLY